MNPAVDTLLEKTKNWREEFETLRAIILDCKLDEDVKWGQPCYTLDDRNIVLMHGFKAYCALLFFKGALMKDPKGILVAQSENTQSTRQIRFTSTQDIVKLKTVLKSYIREAIEVEKSGAKVELKKTEEFPMPDEFKSKLKQMPSLKKAFEALTPGRQRAYLLHFAGAKQAKTRESRIEKCVQPILDGKGLND
jgi:uncharacterized protein YdeI (YjbR/CyaY-like superfamily)